MRLRLTTLAALTMLSGASFAQTTGLDPSLTLSGFGELGAVETSTNLGLYHAPGQWAGVGGDSIGFSPDTKLGIQANGKLNSVFSGTAQLLTKMDGSGTYLPQFEWAFVKAQVLPSLALRVGRMGAPFFAVSDYRNVDYANLWVRPPLDVYDQVSLSHYEGVDATYQGNFDGATVNVSAFKGHTDDIDGGTPVHVNGLWGLNATADFDAGFSLRLGRAQGNLSADEAGLTTFSDELQNLGMLSPLLPLVLPASMQSSIAQVGQELAATPKKASFTGVGLSWDRGNFVGIAEYTWRQAETYIPNTKGWAFTEGYRIGKFTPYFVISAQSNTGEYVNNTIPNGAQVAGLPAPIAGALNTLYGTVNGILASGKNADQTKALGLRWDFYRNLALKAQVDRITPTDGDAAYFNSAQLPALAEHSVYVYSLALSFVF